MKNALLSKFDRLMVAITFAEEAEFETARQVMRQGERSRKNTSDRPEMRKQQSLRKSH